MLILLLLSILLLLLLLMLLLLLLLLLYSLQYAPIIFWMSERFQDLLHTHLQMEQWKHLLSPPGVPISLLFRAWARHSMHMSPIIFKSNWEKKHFAFPRYMLETSRIEVFLRSGWFWHYMSTPVWAVWQEQKPPHVMVNTAWSLYQSSSSTGSWRWIGIVASLTDSVINSVITTNRTHRNLPILHQLRRPRPSYSVLSHIVWIFERKKCSILNIFTKKWTWNKMKTIAIMKTCK